MYRAYWALSDKALADPSTDWTFVPSCWEQPLAQQPEAESPYWRDGNASQGEVVRQVCRKG